MSEALEINKNQPKEQRYQELLPQLEGLIEKEGDIISNLANISAALKEAFDFFWVGFYIVKSEKLILGPFQGPVACSQIAFGKGVCGKTWEKKQTIVVDDVDLFPGHITCNSASKSEIVVPIINSSGKVFGVLDVDSSSLKDFDQIDRKYLEYIVRLIPL